MNTPRQKPLNTQIYSDASDWLVEFRSGDIGPTGRREFYEWLRTSPEHMRAYLELAAIWNEGSGLDPGRAFSDEMLRHEVHSQANIVTFESAGPNAKSVDLREEAAPAQVRIGRRAHLAWAAALAVIVAGSSVWAYQQRGAYATGIGEKRTLALSDGSSIELNARSKVRVRFSSSRRSIELLAGQAFFSVAQDKNRPLIVTSGKTRVRAVGTQFDVYRKASGTTVTVVEGRVSVSQPPLDDVPARAGNLESPQTRASPHAASEFFLGAGEQAVVTEHTAVRQLRPNVPAIIAWTQGRLVFQGTPLPEVADEFNRYNQRRLTIRDPELARFKITGVFSSTDPSSLVHFLEARPGIAITEAGNEILVTGRQR
jgi:transmembrane sensor